jgi:hypothetical protein
LLSGDRLAVIITFEYNPLSDMHGSSDCYRPAAAFNA